jgi:hypothetical protein
VVGKPEGKRSLGRPKCKKEDDIKMDFREIGCEGVGWIHLAQERNRWWTFVNTVLNLLVP